MTDNLTQRGPTDRTRINVHEPWELDWWCRKWGVTAAQLRAAVRQMGVMAKDVAAQLNKQDA